MKKHIAFIDGALVPVSARFAHSLSPGILSGTGVFETMRVYNGESFALAQHMRRLEKGLAKLHITPPYSSGLLRRYLCAVLRANKIRAARLRVTVWRQGAQVRVSIIASVYRGAGADVYARGYRAVISHIRRKAGASRAQVKSIEYLCSAQAFMHAKKRGYQEAIFLNGRGHIVEATRANIFFVKDGVLCTPSLSCGCLNGITRQIVCAFARQLLIPLREARALPADLFSSDEAFCTNSLIEIMPLVSAGKNIIGTGRPGAITRLLMRRYRRYVRASIATHTKTAGSAVFLP